MTDRTPELEERDPPSDRPDEDLVGLFGNQRDYTDLRELFDDQVDAAIDRALGGQRRTLPGSRTVTEVGDQTLPGGGTLIRIRNPEGADAPAIFVVRYRIFGVDFSFEVGDRARLNELFGGLDAFEDIITVNQRQFDNQDFIEAGSIDEILGSTESLASQIERGIRALGAEGVPDWLARDKQAMTLMVLAEQDGWSQARLYEELAKTDAFGTRFPSLEAIAARTGTDDTLTNVTEFLRTEGQLRGALNQFRGPVEGDYVANLVANGWQQGEVTELLELEAQLVNNPDSLQNINELLAAQNLDVQLTADDFINFMQEARRFDQEGFEPTELFRTINDALRFSALEQAGVTVSTQQALGFGAGDAGFGIADPTFFRDEAQQIAGILAANFNELADERLGLSRDDVLNFFLDGEGGGDPRTRQLLERFGRERGIRARGFDRPQTFIDAQGRLRALGFADLTS